MYKLYNVFIPLTAISMISFANYPELSTKNFFNENIFNLPSNFFNKPVKKRLIDFWGY